MLSVGFFVGMGRAVGNPEQSSPRWDCWGGENIKIKSTKTWAGGNYSHLSGKGEDKTQSSKIQAKKKKKKIPLKSQHQYPYHILAGS